METILSTVVPAFCMIIIGYVFKRKGFPGDDFWPLAEKFTYFLLLPMLFFKNTLQADFAHQHDIVALGLAVGLAMLLTSACAFLFKYPLKINGKQFGSFYQGSIRFNNYVGIPVIFGLQGQQGLLTYAIIIAISVPLSNILTVAVMTHYSSGQPFRIKNVLIQIAKNPLIIACFAGITGNLLGIRLGYAMEIVNSFAAASLAFGLVTVGAGLHLQTIRSSKAILTASCVLKLLINPVIVYYCCIVLHVSDMARDIAVVYSALPVAASSYVLAKQYKSDAELMTSIIAVTTIVSGLALTIILLLIQP